MATPKQRNDEPPDDEEAKLLWRDFFDTTKTSIANALGHFQIEVDPTDDCDEDEPVPYEFFDPRPLQLKALRMVEDYFWKLKRRAARLVVLKARRYGMTTFLLLLGLERVLRIPGYQVLLIAQDDASARKHFQRLRDAFQQIPAWVLKARGIEVVKDTDQQLVLRHEGFKTSEFHVAPAKRNALGRGARYNFLILTEFPNWPKSAKADLSGILAACRNTRGNIVIFESTAKGYEVFHRRYMNAKRLKSDYRALFIAAFEHPGNRKKFANGAAEDEFIKSIGTLKEYGSEDEIVLFRRLTVDLKWTPHDAAEHLNWRRTEIEDVCEGLVDVYHRENPNTDAEAFLGTGMPILPKQILEAWRPVAEKREESARVGSLFRIRDRIEFLPDRHGPLTVFEEPEPGERYAFGADVASGIAQLSDGKTEADFSYLCIKNLRTKVTVARFRAHVPPDEYAVAIFLAAIWYGAARGYIERAINDAGVCISTFETLEFREIRGPDLLLSQKRAIGTDTTNMRANYKYIPGFQTTTKTKPELVYRVNRMVKSLGVPEAEKVCPWDIQFIDEGGKFERDESTGRMGASEGHDDAVMAEGLCLEAIERIMEDPDDPNPIKKGGKPTGDEILIEYAKLTNAHRETESVAPGDPDMPGF